MTDSTGYKYTSVESSPDEVEAEHNEFPDEFRSWMQQTIGCGSALIRRFNLKSLRRRPFIAASIAAILVFLLLVGYSHHTSIPAREIDGVHAQIDHDIIAEADASDREHGLTDDAELVPVRDGKADVPSNSAAAHITHSEDGKVSTVIEAQPAKRKVGMFVHELASDSRLEAEHMLASIRADHVHTKVFHRLRDDNQYPFECMVFPELQKGHLQLSQEQKRGLREWVLQLGGRLVVAGDYHGHGAMLVNLLFGKKYTAVDHSEDNQPDAKDQEGNLIWDGSLPASMAHDALWTKYGRETFKQGPSSLPAINAVWGLQSKSVAHDERMFSHKDGATTVVAMFKYGRGSVFFLGYDWFQDPNNQPWNTALWSAMDLA